MKKYYNYSESSYKGNFPEYYKGFKYSNKNRGGIHIAYYSFCYKQNMIDIIGKRIASKNWVKDRVSDMGNVEAMALCDQYPNCIIVVEDRSNQIIELIKIKALRL